MSRIKWLQNLEKYRIVKYKLYNLKIVFCNGLILELKYTII